MPRLAGVNLVGALLAAIVIYFIGFLWYGLLFSEPYMNAIGVYFNEAGDAATFMTADGPQDMQPDMAWMLAGMVIPLVLAFGLGWPLRRKAIQSVASAALSGLALGLLIGLPLMAYDLVYTPWHSLAGFLVDGSHTLVTFVAGAIVLALFD